MRKKSKLFLSMASMVLTVALFCFGVYAALGVSYTISGSVVYQVKDVFVNIQTSLYMSKDTSLTDQVTLNDNVALFESNQSDVMTQTNTEKLAYSDGLSTYNPDTGEITNSGEAVSKTSANIPINYGSYEAGAKGFAYYIVVKITNYGTEDVNVTVTNNINSTAINSLTKVSGSTTISAREGASNYSTKNIVIGLALDDATQSIDNVIFNVSILIERDTPITETELNAQGMLLHVIDETRTEIIIESEARKDNATLKIPEIVKANNGNVYKITAISTRSDGNNYLETMVLHESIKVIYEPSSFREFTKLQNLYIQGQDFVKNLSDYSSSIFYPQHRLLNTITNLYVKTGLNVGTGITNLFTLQPATETKDGVEYSVYVKN